MNQLAISFFVTALVAFFAAGIALAGPYHEVTYPPAAQPQAGVLQLGVTYTLWIPPGVTRLRGLIVHQHGAGAPACQGGATAAYDLHWQALAKRWDCALLGPSYQQSDQQNAGLWCDPRQGSEPAFLKALRELGEKSQHPELAEVPWCLWGHSAGAYWSNLMLLRHPERVVAVWLRSGAAGLRLGRDEAPPEVPRAAYAVPIMVNPGIKEKDDQRFGRVWTSALSVFQAYRAAGGLIGFAPDPRTSHECGDSRYLAIPFFDACLSLRLPDPASPGAKLKPMPTAQAWLAAPMGAEAVPAAAYPGNATEAVWLPNETMAKAWMEYVKTGAVGDTTPPPAPTNLRVTRRDDQAVELTWDAEADFESGLAGFIILRDGKEIARLPEKPIRKFGRPLFQVMSYHDTPERPLPEMRFLDRTAQPGVDPKYQVIAVNSAGLESR